MRIISGERAIFWTLVGVGLATLAALFTLPETLPAQRRSREPLARALARYGELLLHRPLLGYAGAGGFFYGGMFAYIAGTPFAYMTDENDSDEILTQGQRARHFSLPLNRPRYSLIRTVRRR